MQTRHHHHYQHHHHNHHHSILVVFEMLTTLVVFIITFHTASSSSSSSKQYHNYHYHHQKAFLFSQRARSRFWNYSTNLPPLQYSKRRTSSSTAFITKSTSATASTNHFYRNAKQEQDENNNHQQVTILQTPQTKQNDLKSLTTNKRWNVQLLLLDNYDSYTYNLYSYLCTICTKPPIVITNNAYKTWDDLSEAYNKTQIDGIVISPGPGRPEQRNDIGICLDAIEQNPNMPILGVCLGHQALGYYYNASVTLSPNGPVHGLTSPVWYTEPSTPHNTHNQTTHKNHNTATSDNKPKCQLFQDIPQLFPVVRYHSLTVQFPPVSSVKLDIEPIAWCKDDNTDINNVMALQHKNNPHIGVQFHPESIGTGKMGYQLLSNFCSFCFQWQNWIKNKNSTTATTTTIKQMKSFQKDGPNVKKNGFIIQNKQPPNNEIYKKPRNQSQEQAQAQEEDRYADFVETNKYQVLIHKLNIPSNSTIQLPLPEEVFEYLYASMDTSFWLDSSTGSSEPPRIMNGCPIKSISRFSIMGGNDGPLFQQIEYFGKDFTIDQQGLYITQTSNNKNTKTKQEPGDILSHLRMELSKAIPETKFIINLEESHVLEDTLFTTELPFDYRGGYVGYLGYEVRHDTMLFEKENVTQTTASQQQSLVSDPNIPTAAFLFADRSLVYDHWKGDWYIIAITNNTNATGKDTTNEYKGDTNTNLQDCVAWMRTMSINIQEVARFNKESLEDVTDDVLKKNRPTLDFQFARSKEQYINDIAQCHEKIRNGESYELCLTNQLNTGIKFPNNSKDDDDDNAKDDIKLRQSPFGLYKILRKKNPSPFAAFIKLNSPLLTTSACKGSVSICCSSPERFLSIKRPENYGVTTTTRRKEPSTINAPLNNHGWEFTPPFTSQANSKTKFIVESKPIKGTSSRIFNDDGRDATVAEELRLSVKNRAENLMIVDLLRNDLSRVCEAGSVHVPKLMQVESFATVHQLVSTIQGTLDQKTSNAVDVISACFPGGSMTGAPKLRSVDILDDMELGASRGPYSGSLGYISLNGCADMNILIRSAVVTPDSKRISTATDQKHEVGSISWKVSIGAGGAITALSDSEDEFDEMLLKARAVKESVCEWFESGNGI